MKTKLFLTIAISFIATMAFSQNKPWKEHGNNINNSAFLGTTNNKALKFKTNNQLRMKIKKNGKVVVKDSMQVEGTIEADSLVVNKGAHIFGPLHVGANSISINSQVVGGSGGIYDEITSSFGVLNIGGDPIFSTIQVGIGTQTPFATLPTVYGLEVNNDINLTSSVPNHGYRIGGVVVLQAPALRKYFVHII